jgi:alanine racemase
MTGLVSPSRLRLDGAALVENWRWLARQSQGAACGAAIKADGYGLGANQVFSLLLGAGCRDFFVATWGEALALGPVPDGVTLSVLHGVREVDMAAALASKARPTLNSLEQIARWQSAGGGLCDVMVDTGMNRLGISAADIGAGAVSGLIIDTLMSHLASADENAIQNETQCIAFSALAGKTSARRMSLANSAGICLGDLYAFDLTRPGLALYGGIPRTEAVGHIRPVFSLETQVLQRRTLQPGMAIGYNATHMADKVTEVAILNLGYADGYLRAFSAGVGSAFGGGSRVLGRVSMDLTAIDVTNRPAISEGDWIPLDYDLARASSASGLSQYELLTLLGARHDRIWR